MNNRPEENICVETPHTEHRSARSLWTKCEIKCNDPLIFISLSKCALEKDYRHF